MSRTLTIIVNWSDMSTERLGSRQADRSGINLPISRRLLWHECLQITLLLLHYLNVEMRVTTIYLTEAQKHLRTSTQHTIKVSESISRYRNSEFHA